MSVALNPTIESKKSWVFRLPSQLACCLLAFCLLSSQLNPCDATSVSIGSSLTFILLSMGIGCLVAIDTVLNSEKNEPNGLQQRVVVAFVLFGVWLWVCTAMVPGKGNARFATNGCWQWIAQGMLAISVATLSLRNRIGASVVALMLGCSAGTVANASYQYFVSMPALRKMFALDPNAFFEKMDVVAGSAEAMQLSSRLGSLEPTGPFALTNSLAGLMATWLVFIIVLLVGQATSSFLQSKPANRNRASDLLALVLIVAFFWTLLLTKSRSAWLATLLSFLAACIAHPSLRQGGLAFAYRFRTWMISAGVMTATALGVILIRDPLIFAEAGKSLSYRLDYWRGALTLIQREPYIGYGVANFQQSYNRVKLVTASESPADPHNFILETAIAGGLPLLAILIAILSIVAWKAIDLGRSESIPTTPFERKSIALADGRIAIMAGSLCGCIGLLAFEFVFGDIDSIVSVVLFVGATLSIGLMVSRCDWLMDDRNTSIACMISLTAMLVHLLASGGWMQPGMMNSVCVLGGLVFGLLPRSFNDSSANKRKITFGFSVASLLLVLAGTADFAKSMCFPVLASSGVKSIASGNPNAMQDASDWLEIIKVDSRDPELPLMAAKQMVELLSKGNLSNTVKQKYCSLFDSYCHEYLLRDAKHWVPFAECGRWNAILADIDEIPAEKDSGKSRIELSYQYFAKSAEFYPNSAQTQLQAAIIAAWCGKLEESKRHADQAEEIDRQTPHADRKLTAIVVFFPKKLEKRMGPLEGVKPMGQVGLYQGEPIMRWLRNYVR